MTRQGKRLYPGGIIERKDPKSGAITGLAAPRGMAADPESDFAALAEGRIPVTPLHLDLTNHRVLAEMRDWNPAP